MAQRLALIIGNSVYRDATLSRLATPDVDVGDLADLLLDSEIGNFDDVKVLANMSFGAVRSAISDFYARKSRDDLLLLYFSGHGVLDDRGRLFLAVKDTNTKLLRDRAIAANFIADEMNNSYSQRQILVLDCCHSGAFERGTKGQTGARVGTATAFEGTGYGRVVLTASDATQYAWEGDQIMGEARNSLFTHFLVQGLKSGEADLNDDGKITVDELFDYVYEKVVRQTPKQIPGKWSYKERGEIILALHQVEPPEIEIDQPSPDLGKKIQEESERSLEKLYLRGLTAYHLEDWENAVQCFTAVAELRSDYRDTTAKLADAERNAKLAKLYEQMEASEAKKDWQLALSSLEELIALAPDYRDIANKEEGLRTHMRLFELYLEAQQLFMAEQWKAVLSVFTKINAIQPDYPDADGLKAIASQKVAELERQELVNELYERSLFEIEAERWDEAHRLLTQVWDIQPDYEATEKLLTKVEAAISKKSAEAKKAREDAWKKRYEPETDRIEDTIVTDDRILTKDVRNLEADGSIQPVDTAVEGAALISASPKPFEGVTTSAGQLGLREFALLAPGAVLFVFLQGFPLLSTFWLSLQNYRLIGAPAQFVGFENYLRNVTIAGPAFGNTIWMFMIRAAVVTAVWFLLRTCWRRMQIIPVWLVLAALAPLPFLFSLGNTVSWVVFGSDAGPFGASPPLSLGSAQPFMLAIDGLNTFAASSAAGLFLYTLVQRIHPPGSPPGITALKIMRNGMFVIAAASALQAYAPGIFSARAFDVPLIRVFWYQAQMQEFGAGAAIASLVIVALIACAWLLWRTLKSIPLRLVLLAEPEKSGQNRTRAGLLPLALGVLPGLIILLPYLYLMITGMSQNWSDLCSSNAYGLYCSWTWSGWLLTNLIYPGLVIWIVQLPVAFLSGYVLALKRLPGRNTNRILTGLILFSALPSMGVLSGALVVLLRQWDQLGLVRTLFYPLAYSGLGVMVFMIFMKSMAEQVNRAREAGKSERDILRHEIYPQAFPLILLFGIISMYAAGQRYIWPLWFSQRDQWTAGVYLYNTLRYYPAASTIVPAMVYTFAIPCAVAIVLLVRKLLQRLAIRVETQPAA